MSDFAHATAIRRVSSHKYEAYFPSDWCIGSVPHGGFVTSCFMNVAKQHFCDILSRQAQPDTMSLHLEFIQRTEIGTASFAVKEVKLGRTTSTLHITLSQNGRDEVIGYVTNTDMAAARGLSIDTHWKLSNPPVQPIDARKIETDEDPNWAQCKAMPFADFRPAAEHVDFFFPRQGHSREFAVVDQWVRFRNGQRFTNTSLGYVVDNFAQIIEILTSPIDPYHRVNENAKAVHWFPTLLLNLDVKKSLPAEGVDWLFVRVQAKQIKNGRYDLEVTVTDLEGELVALSHHVCMILAADRNTARRSDKLTGSKL